MLLSHPLANFSSVLCSCRFWLIHPLHRHILLDLQLHPFRRRDIIGIGSIETFRTSYVALDNHSTIIYKMSLIYILLCFIAGSCLLFFIEVGILSFFSLSYELL